jgi:GTP-binding protein HflX
VDAGERSRLARRFPGAVPISAATGEGLPELLEALARTLPAPPIEVDLLIPFDREDLLARLYRDGEVLESAPDSTGMAVRARVGERELAAVRDYVTSPVTRRADAG